MQPEFLGGCSENGGPFCDPGTLRDGVACPLSPPQGWIPRDLPELSVQWVIELGRRPKPCGGPVEGKTGPGSGGTQWGRMREDRKMGGHCSISEVSHKNK